MANANKVVLIVMDGWGHGPKTDANAIFKARTPFIDSLYANYPNAELLTSGEDVGLPAGQMGNSEVGHLNIGAGRVVYQDLVRINLAIRDGSIFREKTLVEAFAFAKANNKPVHFLGLVSDGGVHSHLEHLKALAAPHEMYVIGTGEAGDLKADLELPATLGAEEAAGRALRALAAAGIVPGEPA